MKNLIVLMLMLFAVTMCGAQGVVSKSTAEIVYLDDVIKRETAIDSLARPYEEFFSEAKANPDVLILVDKSRRQLKKLGILNIQKNFKEKAIIYDSTEDKIFFVQEKREDVEIYILIILGILILIGMIIFSNIKRKVDKILPSLDSIVPYTERARIINFPRIMGFPLILVNASLFILTTFMVTINVVITLPIIFAIFLVFVSSLFALSAIFNKKDINYKILLFSSCVFMILYFILLIVRL